MATLYDLELQESNNFINAVMYNGETPTLRKMRLDLHEARNRGSLELVEKYENLGHELGVKLKRLTELESDMRSVMRKYNLTPELARQADRIFAKNPKTFQVLNENERQAISTYWIKKKSCLAYLFEYGYTPEEVFSYDYYKTE